MRFVISLLMLLLTLTPALAQDNKKSPDHGRVMACCLDVFPHKLKDTTNIADTRNYVFRGKVISLGKDKNVSICYDVEHMRVAGAWVGKPFVYSAEKNMGPTVEGEMLFATKPGPGWADPVEKRASRVSGGSVWDDPREGKEGPLPRDWAHYKGLYVHGDKVVLSYTVGDMDVLEMAEGFAMKGCVNIDRRLRVGPTRNTHQVQICNIPGGQIVKALDLPPKIPKGITVVVTETVKEGEDRKNILVVADSAELKAEGDRLIARLTPSNKAREIRISIRSFDGDKTDSKEWRAEFQRRSDELNKDFALHVKGGPARWTETPETTITPGDANGPYALDQIGIPEKNPWNASIRFAGLDFFPDGRAALCTWDGDVWIVSGLDDKLAKVRWKRFASGLQHPLGLKIINGHIYTAGRDQITKLHDLNNDGEADFYENINNDAGLTLQRHEFVMDLQTDKDGNLYFCRSGHYVQSKRGDNCVVYKMSPDGKKLEKIARGFREPNGMSIGPDGTMTIADNEGNGIPQTPLYRLLPGKDYGFTPSATGNPNLGSFKLKEPPIVWLGPKLDTSAGGQVWVPVGKPRDGHPWAWGPLAGQLLHTSYGNCALYSVLIDKTADPWQGAVWKFPLTFNSGIMRARFSPTDGQLYVCGLRGWGTSAVKDGQFARVRYTGKYVPIPVGFRVVKTGIEIAFSSALDKTAAQDEDNWAGTWSAILKKVPNAKETQEMPITSVRLSADRKTATVALEKVRSVPNFTLRYQLKAADGASVSGELNGTIHRFP